MDSPSGADDAPRAKFLCSFGGSILPRPLDGRLRYVGGETRIVSLPRDVSFTDLLSRMRDLFDLTSTIKYQSPDEDLDSLVSLVNDDDVINMMEDYDKLLSSSDGTVSRLRIFLFPSPSHSHSLSPDSNSVAAFDEDTERRYVDALNSLAADTKPNSPTEIISDQFFAGHPLNIPGHPMMEPPWSPAYFSPREFSPSHSARYEQPPSPPVIDNMMWLPPGAVVQEKAGFPNNLGHSHNVYDGSGGCEHCRMGFPRMNMPYVDPRWNQGGASCGECYRSREPPPAQFYNETPHGDHRGWGGQQHHHHHHRVGDHYLVDGNVMNVNVPYAAGPHGNYYDGNDDVRGYANVPRPGNEFGSEQVFHPQQVGHGNHPSQYGGGGDSLYQVPHNLPPIQSLMRKVHVPVRPGVQYESPGLVMSNGFMRTPQDGSPRVPRMGVDDQIHNAWGGQNGVLSQNLVGVDEYGSRMNLNPNIAVPDGRVSFAPDPLVPNPLNHGMEVREENQENLELDLKGLKLTEAARVGDSNANVGNEHGGNHSVECLTYLPELIASVKKAVLEGAEVVKLRAEENGEEDAEDKVEPSLHELEAGNGQVELEPEPEGEVEKISEIEPTTAEAEALAKGLQTIKNDDLEEIRELGSGTYGSVFHGKWRGSDVAIKRIKASCFAGKPSERERLIADFWKEALILSSLHHPNVVSFYGVVRDGPDGSLATVTEFMVNGSLKQFLQKKDRTIDRRKRLIIAMDAAFGMEYLHGKNIVHFDMKCENLLVNMRDPQRPICKIGDLGLSKVKQHTLVSGGVRGTLPWMAPELLSGKSSMVTEKIDVYSFGIVMWELLTGEEPYASMRCASIIGGIVNGTLRPQIPTWCDPEWKSLMESCWSSEPGERPSFSEISQKLRKMSAAVNVK